MEHPKRSLFKAVTWRVGGFITSVVTVYIYSHDIKQAFLIGVTADSFKIFLYYLHERLWNRIDYSEKKVPEYQI